MFIQALAFSLLFIHNNIDRHFPVCMRLSFNLNLTCPFLLASIVPKTFTSESPPPILSNQTLAVAYAQLDREQGSFVAVHPMLDYHCIMQPHSQADSLALESCNYHISIQE